MVSTANICVLEAITRRSRQLGVLGQRWKLEGQTGCQLFGAVTSPGKVVSQVRGKDTKSRL